jgi:large subunit ribosomal protein L7A
MARDADRRVLNPVIALCKEKGVKINWVDCQAALGQACGLMLGASTVGFLRDDAVLEE